MTKPNLLYVLEPGASPAKEIEIGSRLRLGVDASHDHPVVFGTGLRAYRMLVPAMDFVRWVDQTLPGFAVTVEWPANAKDVIWITEGGTAGGVTVPITMRAFLQNMSRRFDIGIGMDPREPTRAHYWRITHGFHSKVRHELDGGYRYGFEVPVTRKTRL
jgi:hypothetical protein